MSHCVMHNGMSPFSLPSIADTYTVLIIEALASLGSAECWSAVAITASIELSNPGFIPDPVLLQTSLTAGASRGRWFLSALGNVLTYQLNNQMVRYDAGNARFLGPNVDYGPQENRNAWTPRMVGNANVDFTADRLIPLFSGCGLPNGNGSFS